MVGNFNSVGSVGLSVHTIMYPEILRELHILVLNLKL